MNEKDYSYCPLCREYKRPEEMGTFNCLECEAELEREGLEVESLIVQFESIVEGRNDRGKGRVHDYADTGGPGVSQRPLFD